MIGIIFKSTIAFVLSFIVLSIPISNKPLFKHISDFTGPLGGDIKKSFSKSVDNTVKKTKQMSNNLFSGSDSVKSKQSSILSKRRKRIKQNGKTSEELHHSEKTALDNVINK
jgi:hypothetical protein